MARLATVGADGAPHIVPVVFAHRAGAVWMPVDGKPKRHTRLKRLANIRANPRVALLIDHYAEDWQALWWVRVEGTARRVDRDADGERALRDKYPQYAEVPITSLILLEIERTSAWRAR